MILYILVLQQKIIERVIHRDQQRFFCSLVEFPLKDDNCPELAVAVFGREKLILPGQPCQLPKRSFKKGVSNWRAGEK